ncbi:MAG: gliding motility lipoprotein GldD [Bacteroidetes bacterium]|nr:MAG: gliding motility lipoprotein GldD [Bacteroidota bacterium]
MLLKLFFLRISAFKLAVGNWQICKLPTANSDLGNTPKSGFYQEHLLKKFYVIFGLIAVLTSCEETKYPKPKGYLRIDLPQKEYILFDSTFPYSFEYPAYAKLVPDNGENTEPYWLNLEFPKFKGKVYLSYKKLNGNLPRFIEESRNMVMKHIPKASSIEQKAFENPASKVYGLTYTISGSDAASPFQFYLTDSTNHFLRGALYFHAVPNNDSLAPVIKFIEEDIQHLIEGFRWE